MVNLPFVMFGILVVFKNEPKNKPLLIIQGCLTLGASYLHSHLLTA